MFGGSKKKLFSSFLQTAVVESFALRENQFFQAQKTLEQKLEASTTQLSQDKVAHTLQTEELSSKISALTQRLSSEEIDGAALKVCFSSCFLLVFSSRKRSPNVVVFNRETSRPQRRWKRHWQTNFRFQRNVLSNWRHRWWICRPPSRS